MNYIEMEQMAYPIQSPIPHYSMVQSRSFTPDQVDSPTYSLSSSTSDKYYKPTKLSPLPDAAYYPPEDIMGVPLLTPPASETYYNYPQDLFFWDTKEMPFLYPQEFPMPQPCYAPGCRCNMSRSFLGQEQLPPPPPYYQESPNPYPRKRQYKSANRSNSLSSTTSNEKSSSSSSTSASTPRRYKCTLCVKRFTRPSSLATHMHSHTGEVCIYI